MSGGASSDKAKLRVSENFNEEDADVTFQLSDDVLFRIHSFSLKACTEGFSPPECSTFEEIVPLTETASTLELLFQFIYPMPQPDLALLDFALLESVAESAEKYQVFPAMNICKLHMRNTLPKHADAILAYAQMHGYHDVISEALPLLLVKPLEESTAMMSSEYMLPWVKYYAAWARVASTAIFNAPTWKARCASCSSALKERGMNGIVHKLAACPGSLQNLDGLFRACCTKEGSEIFAWRKSIEDNIKNIPKFADLIRLSEGTSTVVERRQTRFSEPWAHEGNMSDIIFKSKDGKYFHVHRLNLEAFTTGLIASAVAKTISLTESASTLGLLFQFIYPARQPDLESLDFDILASLALAAEKYEVHSARRICRLHMTYALPNHPSGVMAYAAKNSFYDLMNAAGPLLIRHPIEESLKLMTLDLVTPWVRYYECWNAIARKALSFSSSLPAFETSVGGSYQTYKFRGCRDCRVSLDVSNMKILCKLGQGGTVLHDLDSIFDLESACCQTRRECLRSWRSSVEEGIRGIPKFDTFV